MKRKPRKPTDLSAIKADAAVKFGKRLRELRRLAGLTQAELAGKAEVTEETVGRLERIYRRRVSEYDNPTLHTIVALAHGLGVTVSELMRFE